MRKKWSSSFIFFVAFILTVGFGFFLLTLPSSPVQAANINVSGTVPIGSSLCGDGILNGFEQCDSGVGSGNCYNNQCNSDCTCPVCGNGTIEAGESCESNSDCSDGATCTSSCACQQGGGGPPPPPACIPGTTVCSWGQCVDGSQSGFCSNGCSTWPAAQSCVIAVCGNSTVDPGEECDDGNTVSGDGCSASCQLEFGCGNSTVDPGEECDDNNTVSGDCCSTSCTIELLIDDVVESSITNTSALISWNTLSWVSNSCSLASANVSLEWGSTTSVSDGSVSGFSGSNFSYQINGLEPNTTYFYRITATRDALQEVYNGSFRTLGGVENCTNGIDDDSDGFCDYPASTCTDGAVAGDHECGCSADFVCTPGACDADGRQVVVCEDQTVPTCQPSYQFEQDCDICPGVIPGACQQVDPNTCSLIDIPNCCGNGTCEPPNEDPYTCTTDCPVSCLSNWECGHWQPEICPAGGIQTRECFDTNGCETPINPPPTTQTCGGTCPGLSCGAGEQVNTQNCTCEKIVPFCGNGICEAGESHESCAADCVEVCTPSWTCNAWGSCSEGVQTRTCEDLNNCDLNLDRPPEIRSCTPGCDIACGTCAVLDLDSCSCLETALCCGNRACEENETIWSCVVDCGLPPTLRLSLTACLDGLDNDGDGLVDYPLDPGCATPGDNSELNIAEVVENVSRFLQEQVLDKPQVEQVNQRIAAPVIITTATVSTFATFSFFNFFSYFQYLFTQPFAILARRKRKKWGVVYNALSKQPVDLAIVRLYKKENGQLVQSRVTDKQGRYNFLAEPGRYYLTVTKPKFDFPTNYLKDKKEDANYLDLYHGETIEVTDKTAAITANIPLDSQVEERQTRSVILRYYLRKAQYAISFSAVPLAATSMVLSPGVFTFSLFGFHCLLYVLFRRLGYQKKPKSWGIVYDKDNKKPLGRAIARIYDKGYNKLLETRVTDTKGRYSFLVNNNIYYVTAEKMGYQAVRTDDIDLVSKDVEAVVGQDIALEKARQEAAVPAPSLPSVQPPPTPTPPPGKVGLPSGPPVPPAEPALVPRPSVPELEKAVGGLAVGRESLEDLLSAKEEIQDIKEDIQEKDEQLHELEEKVEDLKEDIEKRLEKFDIKPLSSPKTPPSIAEELAVFKQKKQPPVPPGTADMTSSPESETESSDTTPSDESDKKDLAEDEKEKPSAPPPEKSIFG